MKKTIFTLLTVFIFVGCSNDDDPKTDNSLQMPPETQIGANTFGCYVNGKLLIPRSGSGDISGPDSGASLWGGYPNSTDYYELDIRDYKSERTAKILIHMQSVHSIGIGNYVIDESNGMSSIDGLNHNYIHCKVFNDNTNSYQYYNSFINSGILKITKYDFLNRTICGTFSCRVRNSVNSNDEIEITQGRFDINWNTLPNKIFP